VARFPMPVADRIPNFKGAEQAAARAATLPEWKAARRIKCNPDAPQRALRLRALQDGKLVFMAVPRLRAARCFLRLDPARLGGRLAVAATIKGASALGVPVTPDELGRIDLVVVGSVAVNAKGARVGKGGGYSDLEFALARELGAVTATTPVLTTVHGLQLVKAAIPMMGHDVPVDLIVTPERVIRAPRTFAKPRGIRWDSLSPEQLAAMPPLARLK
jgi:5-formyltetrahydrofolate cyclo-ligase